MASTVASPVVLSASAPLVLVVDDAPINRAVACMLLNEIGCRAVTADGGPAALAAVQAQPVDLVLMDCQMPGMDGFAATSQIRQNLGPGRRLPIIAVTGFDQHEDQERCRVAGMDDLLPKPLQVAALRKILNRWLIDGDAVAGPSAGIAQAPVAAAIFDQTRLAPFDRLQPGSGAILLGIYLKELVAVEVTLGRAVADHDLAAVMHITHKLTGSSQTVGAQALAAAMRGLGQAARAGSRPVCHEQWQRVMAVLAETRMAMSTFRPDGEFVASKVPWPAERATREVVAAQRARILHAECLVACLEAMPVPVMLLNADRQILAANRPFLRIHQSPSVDSLIGKRPGEVLGCVYAEEGPDGCGTSPHCAFCGVTQAVMTSRTEQVQAVKEARMTIGGASGLAMDLEVTTTPITVEGQRFILVAMRDIAEEKKRSVLERIFLHDVLNSAIGVQAMARQLAERRIDPRLVDETHELLAQMAQQLIEEIGYQRLVATAEAGKLHADIETHELSALIREVQEAYIRHPAAAQRSLVLGAVAPALVRTDRVLFRRVLGNLVKNALEATPPGGVVTIGSQASAGILRCTVRNPGVMTPEVRQQLFQRSFSTKGEGHGLGTWSAKLLGERYLGGTLSYTSTAQDGTELTFALPAMGGEEAPKTSATAG